MRIGFIPVASSSDGGSYQYTLTMLRALDELQCNGCADDFVLFTDDPTSPYTKSLHAPGWRIEPLQPPSIQRRTLDILRRIVGEGPHREAWRWLRQRSPRGREGPIDVDSIRYRPEMSRWFHRCAIELMLYPGGGNLSFESGLPYVMTILDLQHRIQPDFPEVSANGNWEKREYTFRNGVRHALLIIVESETGKEDVLNYYGGYGITPDRVHVLPMLPAHYLTTNVSESEKARVAAKHKLPSQFLFYPAQFWLHKNHARIVQALGMLKNEHHLPVPIVFCGTYTGAGREAVFHNVMQLAQDLGVQQQVTYLGYVPAEDMSALYAMATALVMPTFFGPTNIPPLEAFAFGCPVITSDIRGIREQMGNAAILVNPLSSTDIAQGIYQVVCDSALRNTLVERGYDRLASYTPEDYKSTLYTILHHAKELRNSL